MNRQIIIDIPEKVLLAEKVDAEAFGQMMRVLTAVKLFELGRLSSDAVPPNWPACRASDFSWNWNATRFFRSQPS